MSKGISIKIDGKWAAVNEDAEISIEMSSPILNEEGTFSLPFELPYAENRHLFGNLGEPDGTDNLYDLDGKDFELYFDDILLYFGIVETDDEEEITDTIPLNFVSGNAMLADLVEGMKANEVALLNKIYLGYTVGYAKRKVSSRTDYVFTLDKEVFMNYENYNVSAPYPSKPFCNVRICYQPDGLDEPLTLEAKRPWSGVCFYLSYFLDCLFNKLGLVINRNDISDYEDFNRLAFFTTKCKATSEKTNRTVTREEVGTFVSNLSAKYESQKDIYQFYDVENIYATKDNFPDTDINTIISSLKNAFGLSLNVDNTGKGIDLVLIQKVMTDNEILDLYCDIIDTKVVHHQKRGLIQKYASGSDEDTSYSYNDWEKFKYFSDYGQLIHEIDAHDDYLHVDRITGNTYRIKVNKDDGTYPSLFEVAQFIPAKIGNMKDDKCIELSIDFNPIVSFDTNYKKELTTGEKVQSLAIFVDADMKNSTRLRIPEREYVDGVPNYRAKQGFDYVDYDKIENYDVNSNMESPLRSLDSGFTLGVMRGPGNDSRLNIYKDNYDGNGNDAWNISPTNYSFDEDFVNNYGQLYDYNGEMAGGIDISKRFSLKLKAQKEHFESDKQYAGRGLFDKFISEYAYFLTHNKSIMFTVRMELSQLISINWGKKYRIGQRIGYINHINYTLSNSGISDITIELLTI